MITGQSDHTWRTDLLRIEEGEKKYSVVEYYKNGDVVTAEVSMTIPHQRYECHIKGSGYEGKRIFSLMKKNSRTILSMEEVICRSKRKSKEKITLRVRFLPFLFKIIFKKETEKVYWGSVQGIERRTGELQPALNKAHAIENR